MKTYTFQPQNNSFSQERFLLLGSEVADYDNGQFLDRLENRTEGPFIQEVWGTLGWKDDASFQVSGTISFSEMGNENEGSGGNYTNPVVVNLVKELKQVNQSIHGSTRTVTERFINFDQVEFSMPARFQLSELPQLRLTLFSGESTDDIVFIQHSSKADVNDPESFVEFVVCEKDKFGRKTFFIPLTIDQDFVEHEDGTFSFSGNEKGFSFIVKMLSFRQEPLSQAELFQSNVSFFSAQNALKSNITGRVGSLFGEAKYALLRFNPAKNAKEKIGKEEVLFGGSFEEVNQQNPLDPKLKTLFLIHGTFVDTYKSYQSLVLQNADGKSFLQRLLAEGKYEQIIAFNHPTLSEDPEQNGKELIKRLGDLQFGSNRVDVMTTSRGALVAEYIAASDAFKGVLEFNKILLFSAANGCGYLQAAEFISRGLSIWKNTVSGPGAKLVLLLAQRTVDFIQDLPGLDAMNIHSDRFKALMTGELNNPNMEVKTVVSDWSKLLVEDDKWLKRAINVGLDLFISLALGKEHDWVIGVERQDFMPDFAAVHRAPSDYRLSVHGRYLEQNYVRSQNGEKIDAQEVVLRFFGDGGVNQTM